MTRLRYLLALVAALGGVAVALATVSGAGASQTTPVGITGGQTLTSGSTLASSDGHYQAGFLNGIFSVSIAGGRTLWSVGTSGTGGKAVLQPNGLFVLFNAAGQVEWDSEATGSGCPVLELQLDGNLGDYDPKAIWYANTYQHGMVAGDVLKPGWSLYPHGSEYRLLMQQNGDLVLDNDSGTAIWKSETYNNPGAYATMQSDGNFVIYSAANSALWSTKTDHNPGASFAIDSSGDLEVDSSSGKALWTSKSTGQAGTGSAFSLTPLKASSTACPATPVPTTTTAPAPPTVTTTQTVLVPTTTVVTVTAPKPAPRKRRLDVKLVLDFRFSGDVTTLHSMAVGRLPRGSMITTVYRAHRGARPFVLRARPGRTLVALIRSLLRHRYLPGETLALQVSRSGYSNESGVFTFRAGRLPSYRGA